MRLIYLVLTLLLRLDSSLPLDDRMKDFLDYSWHI